MAFLDSIYKALTGKDVEALLQKLSERESEVQDLKAKIASQNTTITSQSTDIKNLNKNLKESSENLKSIKKKLTAANVANSSNQNARLIAENKLSELEKELSEEQRNKSAIEQRLNKKQVELSDANKQIEELSKVHKCHCIEIKRLTDLLEKASVDEKLLKEQLETVRKSLNEAEQKSAQQTNLLQQEKEKNTKTEQLLSKAELDSNELKNELKIASKEITELTTKLQLIQCEKDKALANNVALNNQLQELSGKVTLQEGIINAKKEDEVNEIVDECDNKPTEIEEDVTIPATPESEITPESDQEDEATEYEIDWDNKELEIAEVEQDTILSDSTLSIAKVWDVRNKKEIDAKQFFSLPEGEIISMRRELQLAITTDTPYWVCPACGQMVKISGKRTARGKALFFSHLHDSEDCPIKTNTGLTKRMIEARKYALVQESERHHRLKTIIANFLEETNSKNKGVSDVQIEKRVTTNLPFMNWRCPDVQAMYNGMHLVFELQLSTTFISTIVERDLFYRLNNYFIIWVFNFEENKEYMDLTNLMCKDIYYANKRNIFVFDRDAQAESFKQKELVLKCNWLNADNTWQYGPNDGDRNGIFITLDQLKFDTKNNKPYYYDAEKEYLLKHQDKLVIREKQELDLQAVLEGLERREQQKRERKELREAKKAEAKENLETVVDVVAEDKVVLPDAVNAESEEKKTLGKINANGHEYVDLRLPSGTLWATCNVGATKPEEYGDYFAWGEVEPKDEYSLDNYKWNDRILDKLTKYCTSSSDDTVDNKTTLDLSDDAAYVNWGTSWRMPTTDEMGELINYCSWIETTQNGVRGCKVTSITNGNSIFLPDAGVRSGSILHSAGVFGGYWSSCLVSSESLNAYNLELDVYVDWRECSRRSGLSVRPVLSQHLYTITFNANGGLGSMPSKAVSAGASISLPANTFTRSGYVFVGWNTSFSGTGTSYTNGQSITPSGHITLYAQWKKIENSQGQVSGSHQDHDYVDLGLPSGTLWATCNVGATKPEEYGDYFAWGEVEPKGEYSWENYKWCKGTEETLTKYSTSSYFGTVDNKTTLDLSDDAAYVNWGSSWRMPTIAELDELRNRNYTTWNWTTQNGVKGYKVTSKANGNSIFLPAAGKRYGSCLFEPGAYGDYWSSCLDSGRSDYAYHLDFYLKVEWGHSLRDTGRSVRAVLR